VNEIELPRLAEMFDLTGDERSQIRQLADRNRLRVVAYTRGRHGSLLFSEGRWSDHSRRRDERSGHHWRGRFFHRAMTLGLPRGLGPRPYQRQRQPRRRVVCSRAGATPDLPEELHALFRSATSAGSCHHLILNSHCITS